MRRILHIVFLLIAFNNLAISQSPWSAPSGDQGQPFFEIWLYGTSLPGGVLEAGDQVAAFDGETLVGLLTLTGTPELNNWSNFRLLAYSKSTNGSQLYTPGHPLNIRCYDADADEIYYAYTWGDDQHIDFHNQWYAPTSDIEQTAMYYGAYFPDQNSNSYCYVNLTFTDTPIEYPAELVISVYDNQTPAQPVLDANIETGGYTAVNNNNGTYTLNLFAGEDTTPPIDFEYTVEVEATGFDTEHFNYTVQANNNNGSGYTFDVFLNTTGGVEGTVMVFDLATGLYNIPAIGAIVSVSVNDDVFTDYTDSSGEYVIGQIPDGNWETSIVYSGYVSDNSTITIVKDDTLTHNADLNLEEGTIKGDIFKTTSILPISDETIRVSIKDASGNVLATTTTTTGSYELSYYAGTYDITIEDENQGTDPEYNTHYDEAHTLYPNYIEEVNYTLTPDPYIPNYDSILGDSSKMWVIEIEMAKFGSSFMLPYDEIVIFDTDQDPDPLHPEEPGKRVGVLHLAAEGHYSNADVNHLNAFSSFDNGNRGFVTGNNMEFWAYDASHNTVYEDPVNWSFVPVSGYYTGTTFPDSTSNSTSYLNIWWDIVPGILSGLVTENGSQSTSIEGVTVDALNIYTNEVVDSDITDVDGAYEIYLDYGAYNIRFSKEGYFTETFDDIIINENQLTDLDCQMTAQVPVELDYSFAEQGFYFVGRPVTLDSEDMLTILDNVEAGNPVFSTDRQNSWVENDVFSRLQYNSDNSAWEPQPYNWLLSDGYQIYFEEAYSFSIDGNLVKPEFQTIELPSAGIYYIPYYPFDINQPDEAIDAFAGILDELDWVMDSKGNRLHSDNGYWIDNIGVMDPKQGYKVKMNAGASLNYPIAGKGPSKGKSISSEPVHFVYSGGNAAQWTYTIYIETNDFDIGDEIAAFSNGVLVGSMVIDSDDPWQNDLNTFKMGINGGYEINTPIEFMAWDSSEGIDYNVGFEMVNVNGGCYAGNKYPSGLDHFSYAIIYRGTVAVDENQIDNNIRVYPNPSSNLVNIESVSNINELYIYNIYGALVDVYPINGTKQVVDLSGYITGTYIFQLHTETGVITKRVIVK